MSQLQQQSSVETSNVDRYNHYGPTEKQVRWNVWYRHRVCNDIHIKSEAQNKAQATQKIFGPPQSNDRW